MGDSNSNLYRDKVICYHYTTPSLVDPIRFELIPLLLSRLAINALPECISVHPQIVPLYSRRSQRSIQSLHGSIYHSTAFYAKSLCFISSWCCLLYFSSTEWTVIYSGIYVLFSLKLNALTSQPQE